MFLGLFDVGWFDWLTPANLILIAVALSSLAGNYFQFRNNRAEVIHKTDLDTIASLERALERVKIDLGAEKARADGLSSELSTVKPELVALMSIDIHELLEFARMKRRIAALERELEELNGQLLEAHRLNPKQLTGGEKGGAV
jgi:hypothetical protein